MAIIDVIGSLATGNDAKGWSLIGQDAAIAKLEFKGQFIAEGQRGHTGSEIGNSSSLNKEKPNHPWLSNDGETFSFSTRLFAQHTGVTIKQQYELLKSFTRRNRTLKRAPIFLFISGTDIGFTCFVSSIDDSIGEFRSDGSLRDVVFDIQLQVIETQLTKASVSSLVDQIKFASGTISGVATITKKIGESIEIPGFSPHTVSRIRTARSFDTLESIAAEEYGSALQGDILRKAQPELANLKSGDKVRLIDVSEMAKLRVTQSSVALKNTLENLALRDEFLALRNRTTTIFV